MLENEKGIVGDTVARMEKLLAGVESPSVQFAWDPANFVQCGEANLTEAAAWIETEAPRTIPNRTGLVHHMLNHFAQRHPDRALAMLRRGEEHPQFIAGGIIWANPERAMEVVRTMRGRAELGDALHYGINGQGTPRENWYHPSPETVNHLGDWERRYELLRDAVASSGIDSARRTELMELLNTEFSDHISLSRIHSSIPAE